MPPECSRSLAERARAHRSFFIGPYFLASLFLVACGGSRGTDTIPGPGQGTVELTVAAGAPTEALPGETVQLRASFVGNVTPTLSWSQVSGPAVELIDEGNGRAHFSAPRFDSSVVLRLDGSIDGTVLDTDAKVVTVKTVRSPLQFSVRSRYDVGQGAPTDLRSMAYSENVARAFVVDAESNLVRVIGLVSPDSPTPLGELPIPSATGGFTPGAPTAVAASHGHLAVAYEDAEPHRNGRVVFFNPATLAELGGVAVGPRPARIASAEGAPHFAVSCSAEPTEIPTGPSPNISDGVGSATLIRIPVGGAGAIDPVSDVTTVDFSGFDGLENELLADGVRLARPVVGAGANLEPRAIALHPEGELAWLGLPANGAVASIDFTKGEVTSLRALPDADFSGEGYPRTALDLGRHVWSEGRPTSMVDAGGSSPVTFATMDIMGIEPVALAGDELVFDFVMGRGPVRAFRQFPGPAQSFGYDASFQHRLVRARLNRGTGEWTLLSELPLTQADGTPISGRPNLLAGFDGGPHHDEVPVDVDGTSLPLDPFGAWLTGVVRVGDEIWCSEARRPSLYRFSSDGTLIDRFVPVGENAFGEIVGTETLPAILAMRSRSLNGSTYGGFQGIAQTDAGEIVALMGAPLGNPHPETVFDSRVVRMLVIDPSTGQPLRAHAVLLERPGLQFTDLAWSDGSLLAIEQDVCGAGRRLVRIDMGGATDLLALGVNQAEVDAGLEGTPVEELATRFAVPVVPARKTLVSDLALSGLSDGFDPSLGVLDGNLLLATADHFELGNPAIGGTNGEVIPCSLSFRTVARSSISFLDLAPRAFDPNGSGAGLATYPVSGIRQVVGLLPNQYSGSILALDGDLVRAPAGDSEATRVRDLVLDTLAFPAAAMLQGDGQLGPLRVSKLDGDPDMDGIFSSLHAFGGRSVLQLDESLNVTRDSGDAWTRGLMERHPESAAALASAAPFAGARPTAAVHTNEFFGELAIAFREAGVVAIMNGSNWSATVPIEEGERPTDLVHHSVLVGATIREYLFVLDAGNGQLRVVQLLR